MFPIYPIRPLLWAGIALVLTSLVLSGCTKSSGGGGDETVETGGPMFSVGADADERGVATASFIIPESTTKLSITAEAPAALKFNSITDEDGTVFVDDRSSEIVSFAIAFQSGVNTAVIPSRDFDPSVSSRTFNVSATAASSVTSTSFIPASGESVTFVVNTRDDGDLRNGTLPLNVFRVGTVAQDEAARSAIARGIEEMRSIYGDVGISLSVTEFDIDGPLLLSNPVSGAEFYASASAMGASPAVNVFLGGDIVGLTGQVLGIASSIPGPPNPTTRSAVVISLLTSAGPDGVFSEDELRILGETIAHESGHYLGLFHPVESSFDEFDPLTDTDICRSSSGCLANGDLIRNLMFFAPVDVTGEGDFVEQNRLTSQQRGVMNQYIAVD